MTPTAPPTVSELLADSVVRAALRQAWIDSFNVPPNIRHEEGGWIYFDITTAKIGIMRAAAGAGDNIDLGDPPLVPGSVVVGTFHTHPNPSSEGWTTGTSEDDEYWAIDSGVPWLIIAEDGTHATGPVSRRGGLSGSPGYPL